MRGKSLATDIQMNLQDRGEGGANAQTQHDETHRDDSGQNVRWQKVAKPNHHHRTRREVASFYERPSFESGESEPTNKDKHHCQTDQYEHLPALTLETPHWHLVDEEPTRPGDNVTHHWHAQEAEDHSENLANWCFRMQIAVAEGRHQGAHEERGTKKCPFPVVLHLSTTELEQSLELSIELVLPFAKLHLLEELFLAIFELVQLLHVIIEFTILFISSKLRVTFQP
mmetsp:Transcript_6373/g.17750  ORF Transcript_6373/g.17750 Transcript_6373/m.17750 type:complete len:227 (+) Transcript_6373:106-786(+)